MGLYVLFKKIFFSFLISARSTLFEHFQKEALKNFWNKSAFISKFKSLFAEKENYLIYLSLP